MTTTTTTTSSRLSQGYQSDDEYTARKYNKSSSVANHHNHQTYSREDFKEIYCINEKAVEGLEKSRSTGFLFLGCLSSYQDSPCRRHHHTSTGTNTSDGGLFTSCVSTEKRSTSTTPPGGGAPYDYHHYEVFPRGGGGGGGYYYHEPLYAVGSGQSYGSGGGGGVVVRPRSVAGEMIAGGGGGSFGSTRESLYNEARRWVWSEQLDRYIETAKPTPSTTAQHSRAARYPSAPISAQQSVTQQQAPIKHVSFGDYFTRSATSTSFDEQRVRRARWEAMGGGGGGGAVGVAVSQERLIDGRCKTPTQDGGATVRSTSSLVGSRTSLSLSVKSQATQTDTFIAAGRPGGPSEYLSLSPRVAQKSRMVSQPTQTNGFIFPPHQQQIYPTTTPTVKPHPLQQPPPQPTTPPTTTSSNSTTKNLSPTEEEFHENYLQMFSTSTTSTTTPPPQQATPTATTTTTVSMTTVISRSPTTLSQAETSSEGSYSLDKFGRFVGGEGGEGSVGGGGGGSDEEEEEDEEEDHTPMMEEEIIKPPEGFQDNGSLYWGLEGELKMAEDDGGGEKMAALEKNGGGNSNSKKVKKVKKRSFRAKSEERSSYGYKIDAATQSSVSLHASLVDLTTEDDDGGIYLEAYERGVWGRVGVGEETHVWTRHEPLSRVASGDSTEGEREFAKKFVALTHRMVHRRASGECYRRLAGNFLQINKRTTLSRTPNTEFGFRIHGSRPVVVSAVESGSPAETAGLEVGDVIMSINGLQVLDSSHSDVVRIASGVETLELELARTKDVVEIQDGGGDGEFKDGVGGQIMEERDSDIVTVERLKKFNGLDLESGWSQGEETRGVWVERTFTLTSTTLSYSKQLHGPPLRILPLHRPHPLVPKLSPSANILTLSRHTPRDSSTGTPTTPLLLLTADHPGILETFASTISRVIQDGGGGDEFMATVARHVAMGCESITSADVEGWAWKLGRRVKSWARRWCVVKDGVLYWFVGGSGGGVGGVGQGGLVSGVGGGGVGGRGNEAALGATHLHGYRVQTVSILGGKRHAFELVPPDVTMRHYYLAVDSEAERKRWLASLEYSIDRWINLHGCHTKF